MEMFGFMTWMEAKGEKETGNVANIMRAENKRRKNLHKVMHNRYSILHFVTLKFSSMLRVNTMFVQFWQS